MIFETHAHYDDHVFDVDRDDVLPLLYSKGVKRIVNVGASLESSRSTLALAGKYPYVFPAVGVHPDEVGELNESGFQQLKDLSKEEKVVAIGEIGLDYYEKKDSKQRDLQKHWFMRQMELARERQLPIIIHSRDAAADTMEIMKKTHAEEIPGVIHCYSYSAEMAQEYVKMGYFIGVGGVVTFKNAKKLRETVEIVPMDRILLETDTPYLTPEPYRGTRNQSDYLYYVIDKIAELKGITPTEVERITEENAYRLFTKVPKNL